MWVLDPPETGDQNQMLDTALTYANGVPVYALTPHERNALHAVYALYEAMLGQPHPDLLPASLNGAHPTLQAAYNQVQKGARLEGLRDHLLASTDSCPYCGFGEPKDLDHYLPRSIYGELAIYSRNLIPSCGPCNNAKRSVVPGAANGFIHPYFQKLPEKDFLTAEVAFMDHALVVTFRVEPAELDDALASKLQFQLDRLSLNDRYAKQINIFLSGQRHALLFIHEREPALTGSYLSNSAASLAKAFGRNDWRVALLRALAQDAAFCADPASYVGRRVDDNEPQ